MKRLFFLLTMIVLAACGGQAEPTAQPEPTEASEQAEQQTEPAATPEPTPVQTDTPESNDGPAPTDTSESINTPDPTATLLPTDTAMPAKTDPGILLELDGQGPTVTDNFRLPACLKTVFYWTVEAGPANFASLIATLHRSGSDRAIPLVNQFSEVSDAAITWPVHEQIEDGEYFFSIENTEEPWTVRVECQAGVVPVAGDLSVEGEGLAVTQNYRLPVCQKSVFAWEIQPDESGFASLIATLYMDGQEGGFTLANEFASDLSEPLTGQKLQAVDDGVYYVTIENTSNSWHIRWECRD